MAIPGRVALAGAVLASASIGVPAHHTYSLFDGNQRVSITGTVEQFEWRNPHVIIWVLVPRQGRGGPDQYALASDSINSLKLAGWKRDSLRAGDVVSVEFYRLRDGRKGGFLIKVRLPDGRELRSIALSVGAIEAAANARRPAAPSPAEAR